MTAQAIYQILIFGPGERTHGNLLRETIYARAADLGADILNALRVCGPAEIERVTATAPLVAVYLGGDMTTHADEAAQLAARSEIILPVVANLEQFKVLTPPALRHINGTKVDWDQPDFAHVVNLILENLALLRRTRRLFLSYRRKESTPVAHQLRVAFDDAGYDAFLDTNSVPKGDDFQAVLWHRLLDSDVLVVLDTPDFLSSDWTQQELAQALAMSIGIVRVVWPLTKPEIKAELATHIYLDQNDFISDELTDKAVRRITAATEALRARCIAARHSNLVVEFCEEAARIGAATVVQPGRYVLATLTNGRRIAAIPAVGVLDAGRYHEASSRFPAAGELADEAVLIYDHRGMLPAWRGFLDWLDNYLPVRGLRVTETASKLSASK